MERQGYGSLPVPYSAGKEDKTSSLKRDHNMSEHVKSSEGATGEQYVAITKGVR